MLLQKYIAEIIDDLTSEAESITKELYLKMKIQRDVTRKAVGGGASASLIQMSGTTFLVKKRKASLYVYLVRYNNQAQYSVQLKNNQSKKFAIHIPKRKSLPYYPEKVISKHCYEWEFDILVEASIELEAITRKVSELNLTIKSWNRYESLLLEYELDFELEDMQNEV